MALGAGLLALALHMLLLAIYANPLSRTGNRISLLAYNYVYPFFHQNWNLFAPVPESNYQMLALYNDGQPEVLDVFGEIVQAHQANRLSGHEALVVAFSNSLHYFEKNSPLQQSLNGPVMNDFNFTILERAVKGYLRQTLRIRQDSVRLFVIVDNVHTRQRRVYFNE